MLPATAIVFCDRCECATARFERGWRAYIAVRAGAAPSVLVVCPDCAERLYGEDEPGRTE